MKIIVTGDAGLIGSAVIHQYTHEIEHEIMNLVALIYTANLVLLAEVNQSPEYTFFTVLTGSKCLKNNQI
ncbi:MAG: hypothetical protein QNL62_13225 [Gammaproteobacteria bacterium]|nr:hypothetical protein [Gammaproteobacteria bacterium]